MKNIRYIHWLSLAASLLILGQIIGTFIKGDSLCFNAGCAMVHSLTMIPTIFFDLAGLAFFQTLFWLSKWCREDSSPLHFWISTLLLIGMGIEGVLLAYQLIVIKTFCSYCLLIAALLLSLNIVAGRRQFIRAATTCLGVILISTTLNFGPSALLSNNHTLAAGTYASRSCTKPVKELYLFFSEKCPHCHNVINALRNCNSCNFHFNPVDRVTALQLADVIVSPSYSPETNKLLLALLGIKTVPVLLVNNPDGFAIIKGEQNIINYVSKACFMPDPLFYLGPDSTAETATQPDSLLFLGDQKEECSVTVDCDKPGAKK